MYVKLWINCEVEKINLVLWNIIELKDLELVIFYIFGVLILKIGFLLKIKKWYFFWIKFDVFMSNW